MSFLLRSLRQNKLTPCPFLVSGSSSNCANKAFAQSSKCGTTRLYATT
jgi:hypothetical protein